MYCLNERITVQGAVSLKPLKLFGPEKPFVKLAPTRFFCKAGLLICCKGKKIEITAELRATWRLCFENTKRIIHPKCACKVSGLSSNGPRDRLLSFRSEALYHVSLIGHWQQPSLLRRACARNVSFAIILQWKFDS